MATPMDIYQAAMSLTDNLNDIGEWDTSDNREYKNRTLPLLNTMINVVYPYSDTYKPVAGGKRPVCTPLTSFDQTIDLDDYICFSVLPEGLCGLLFADENPTMANYHQQIYDERLAALKRGEGMPAQNMEIIDVYDGGYYDENGDWQSGYNSYPYNSFGNW